jgi:hypothetical protein
MAYVVESTFATQVTGSNLQLLRFTSENFAQQSGAIMSGEIRSDRQTANIRRSAVEAAGSLGFELSYGTHDDLLASALLDSAWSSPVTVESAGTVSAVNATSKFTTSTSWDTTPTVGEWIKTENFANAANNGYFKVTAASSTEITVDGTLTDETDKTGVDITEGGALVNGVNLDTYNIERSYEDLSSELVLFLGQSLDRLTISVPTEGIVTGTMDFIGSHEQSLTSSGGTGYDAITTTEPMAGQDVQGLLENASDQEILSFTMDIANNLRTRKIAGGTGVTSVGTGRVEITGQVQAYYASKTLYDKFLNETATSLAIKLEDTDGNAYVIELPQVRYSNATRNADGPNGDVIVTLDYTAYADPTEDITIRIVRFPAA